MKRTMDRTNFALGIAALLIVILLWTFSSFLTQNLFTNGYNKPFFVTYLNSTTFALYLIPRLIRGCLRMERLADPRKGDYSALPPSSLVNDRPLSNERRRSAHYSMSLPHLPPALEPESLVPLTVRETANLAAVFCLLWFVANWALNASLEYTSVASSTILGSMSGFFTLAIGRLFGIETFTFAKFGAVVASFGGVLLVSSADSASKTESSPHVALGDLLAFLSAVLYAFYVTFLKVRTKHESRLDTQLFFGFIGLFNGLCLWPFGLVLHFSGWEVFQLPPDSTAWVCILINMFITLFGDYLYVLAMLKTTPLLATIGASLTIPLVVLGDLWLGHPAALQTLFGAVLVLVAFGAIGWESVQDIEPDAPTPRTELETFGAISRTPSPVEGA